jgi:DNA-damage-inducible protein J
MSAQTSMLHVRLDDNVKQRATDTLAQMGLSVSDAVRLFMHRVVAEQAFPLELKIPNTATRAALAEANNIVRARRKRYASTNELFDSLTKHNKRGGR